MATERGKRFEPDPGAFAAFGPFRLRPAARLLERDGVPVELGGRALDILIALVEQAGTVVSRGSLMACVWPDVAVVEGVLRVHISNLRKALGDGVGGARYITSIAGSGYCFAAPVLRGVMEAPRSKTPSIAAPPARPAHGLPPRLERMAGRDETVRTLVSQLTHHRFVTIVGAAGIGKTTVAVSVGHALLPDFADEVRFIELASVMDPERVAATVASTLGVPVQTDDVLPSLQAFLHDKRLLLVLDNCEHVVDAAAALVERLFVEAPRVHFLVTSREALRVEGERVHRLLPLETPAEHAGMSAAVVQTFPAVQVFLERAAAGGWRGDLTDDDAPVVAEICTRLDGVALALELAASFVADCGLKGTAAMLDDRLGLLLHQGRRTAPPRQHTLSALIAWSHDRLPERERVTLRRLAIFVGTFSVQGAKAVVLEPGDSEEELLETLSELVAKSLLSSTMEDGLIVYRLLETTRVYALERLLESGEFEAVSLGHASFFTERLARAAERNELDPPRGRASDLANMRAALRACFSSPTRYAAGVRLAAAAARMLLGLGLVGECESWSRRALDLLATPNAGTIVELGLQEAFAISTMFSRTNGEDARRALVRGVELARALGGGDQEVRLLGHMNSFLVRRGEFKESLEVAEASVVPARVGKAASQVRAEWMLAFSHHFCGNQLAAEEHCESALRLEATSEEARYAASRRLEGLYSHPHLGALARIQWLRGRADRALAAARRIVQGIGALRHPFEKSSALILCETIFIWCGDWAGAEHLLDLLFELVERYSLGSQRGAAMALRGELLVKTGRPEEGCALLRTAASMQEVERNASFASVYAGALAEGLAATGSREEGLATVERAILEAERRDAGFNLPELLRIKGVLLSSRSAADDGAAVEQVLSSAIDLARRQGALAWELRAATTLAQDRSAREGSADALGDLSTVYEKFSEGMETPDLRAARDCLGRRLAPSASLGGRGHHGICE
jgi:predicted ATPase/DNA-binding winged helix-turn-helix (wHTH) protein